MSFNRGGNDDWDFAAAFLMLACTAGVFVAGMIVGSMMV